MTNHVSASMREDTPHETETTEITHREKIEALVDIICGAGDKAAGAPCEGKVLRHMCKCFGFRGVL